jgi:hypothetical protein
MSAPDAHVLLRLDSLRASTAVYKRKIFGFQDYLELGVWSAPGVVAGLLLRSVDEPYVLMRDSLLPLEEMPRHVLGAQSVELGEREMTENAVGRVLVQRLVIDGSRHCVYTRQYGGVSAHDLIIGGNLADVVGNIILDGWYCVTTPDGPDERAVQAFVGGIGIRGFAEPGQ